MAAAAAANAKAAFLPNASNWLPSVWVSLPAVPMFFEKSAISANNASFKVLDCPAMSPLLHNAIKGFNPLAN